MPYQTEAIPVFYAVNEKYVPYLTVSITSLIDHSNPQRQYELYVLNQNLSKSSQVALQDLAKSNVSIHLISMGKRLASLQNEHNTLRGDYETLTIYYRLFIADMFPEYHRAIYLDADTILRDDIAKLYQTDLHGNLIGAVPDAFARRYDEAVQYVDRSLGLDMDHYFNSGVMLMDLQALRDNHFSRLFMHLLNTYHLDLLAADQDYLNTICQGLIETLPETWNANPTKDGREPVKNPKLVHYAFFDKPWLHQAIPYDEYFWPEAAKSRYFKQLTDQQNAADEDERLAKQGQIIEGLLAHARQLSSQQESFKALFQSGKEHPLCSNQAHKPLRIFTTLSNDATSTPKLNQTMLS